MPTPISSKVFTFHNPKADANQDQIVREHDLFGTASAVILNSKTHKGSDENAYIPVSVFSKGVYVKDQNGDEKIDTAEIATYLDKLDVADGKDGKIKANTAKNDYMDLLGFKSGTTPKIESLATQEITYEYLKKINKACSAPTFIAKKMIEEVVFTNIEKKVIDYVLTNEKTKKYIKEIMYKENPDETIYILEKYGYSVRDLTR
jgi:hypothetical protein